ncbi:hypothetical protein ACWEU6_17780 [Streptosporangium sandarakinum]|uniref:hypothetical protein n=1 Tax=Streptosporangium sandarakinum TaxID=1260955 RepID=UPI0036C7B9D4
MRTPRGKLLLVLAVVLVVAGTGWGVGTLLRSPADEAAARKPPEPSLVTVAVERRELAREAMRDPVFREVVAQADTAVPGDARKLPNTNTLLNRHDVIGIKTGSGTAAGGNLM